MGVDLTLLPVTYESDDILESDAVLPLDSNALIFSFYGIPLHPLEKKFISRVAPLPEELRDSLKDAHYHFDYFGVTTETAYGDPLRYALAGDVQAALKEIPPEDLCRFQSLERAAIAYVMALHPSHKIVLYWW